MTKAILIFALVTFLGSCSSYVRFTSDEIGDGKKNGNVVYDGSKQIIDQLEEDIRNDNKSNKFEGQLLSSSKKWLGTPYQYGGTTRSGVDCSAFVLNVYNDLGYTVPRTSIEQYEFTKKVSSSDKHVGDLVFFRRGSDVGHVGIYVGSNKMIHASTSRGVIIQDLDNEYLKRTFAGFGRVKK
jgi:cell wall-associated NlpC family hydrolase